MVYNLFNFAVVTIFTREFLEASIIIGEYRTIILHGSSLAPGLRREDALAEVTLSAAMATSFALLVIAAVAIPLAVVSSSFNTTTSNVIEGVSKVVAAISILLLSLKIPKWMGIYASAKKETAEEVAQGSLTLRSIRFNVAWNVWREVAECGAFLIPFFLGTNGLRAIPLSALIGCILGSALGYGLYYANKQFENKRGLCIFSMLLLVILSAGLFTGGCHEFEEELGFTKVVWQINGSFWSVDRLPMTILKPFGYSSVRTVLMIACYWGWLGLSALLHFRKYRMAKAIKEQNQDGDDLDGQKSTFSRSFGDMETIEMGEVSLGSADPPDSKRKSLGGEQPSYDESAI